MENAATKPTDIDATKPDAVIDHLCDLCIQDKVSVEAISYCSDCKEYMCQSCQKVHKRGAATKQHRLLSGQEMPTHSTKAREEKQVSVAPSEIERVVPTEAATGSKRGVSNEVATGNKRAVYLEQLGVRAPSDQYYAAINALEILSDGSILVCDYGNHKVKLFDAEYELQFEIKLPAEPYGMALLEHDLESSSDAFEAVVTLPTASCLQKVRVKSRRVKSGSKILLEGRLTTKLKCEKIVTFQENFIVTAYDDMYFCLSVIDKSGKVVRSIYDEPKKSLEVFQSYYEIALSPDEKAVYITNDKLGCVGISLDGGILFKYNEPGEANHYGISVDPVGDVYIACYDTDKVTVISKTGQKEQVIITLKDLKPSFLAYKPNVSRLFVGQVNTNKVLCYQIKLETAI